MAGLYPDANGANADFAKEISGERACSMTRMVLRCIAESG